MNIKTVAEQTGLSAYTLRYYEKNDIIFGVERTNSGHRLYTQKHLDWILFVKKLKTTGMTISDIKKYALLVQQGPNSTNDRLTLMKVHKSKIKTKQKELQTSLELINDKIDCYKKILTN